MKLQVCDVTSPLASVHKIVGAGSLSGVSPSWGQRGSFIQHQVTGEKMSLTAIDGVYVLGTKIARTEWHTNPSVARQGG